MNNEQILDGLLASGCNETIIKEFKRLQKNQKINEQLLLLSRYKRTLLEKLHSDQAKIDCLDYLTYHIKKEKPTT